MPAAVASRIVDAGFNSWLAPAAQQAGGGSMLEVSHDSASAGEKKSSVVQRSRVNNALSVQQPLALAAICLSRVWVVGSVFAAALMQV
jgi:hypothetical protein